MTIAPPRQRFKRSTERQMGEMELRQWAFADAREEDRALEEFESIGFSAAAASVHVRRATEDELWDAIEADDRQVYAEREAGR